MKKIASLFLSLALVVALSACGTKDKTTTPETEEVTTTQEDTTSEEAKTEETEAPVEETPAEETSAEETEASAEETEAPAQEAAVGEDGAYETETMKFKVPEGWTMNDFSEEGVGLIMLTSSDGQTSASVTEIPGAAAQGLADLAAFKSATMTNVEASGSAEVLSEEKFTIGGVEGEKIVINNQVGDLKYSQPMHLVINNDVMYSFILTSESGESADFTSMLESIEFK